MWKLLIFVILQLSLVLEAHGEVPPTITKQPPNGEIYFSNEANPIVLECGAVGQPRPQYRWTKNGQPYEWSIFQGRVEISRDDGTLTINNPWDVDIGQYQCFAENGRGTATANSVFVRKVELFTATDHILETIEAEEGLPLKLSCVAPGGNPKPETVWSLFHQHTYNMKPIENSRISTDGIGNLYFSNVTTEDETNEYVYSCASFSPILKKHSFGDLINLRVIHSGLNPRDIRHEPVMQHTSASNSIVVRGNKIELFCIFGGTPLPYTVWTKDGKVIPWSDRVTVNNHGRSVIIHRSTLQDQGKYECNVTNGVGAPQHHSINLMVKSPPYFHSDPQSQDISNGRSLEILCDARGDPNPFVKWTFNGQLLNKAPHDPRRVIQLNKLLIRNADYTFTGNYGCNATNSYGYIYKDFYLNVV